MNIIIEQLVHHKYDCDEISKKATPNYLKDTINGTVFEINATDNIKHKFSEDISKHDLVIEMKDGSDSYMFFFVNIQIASEGNKRFSIEKIIIDEGLSETCIREFSSYVITTFINGDNTTKHYIHTDKSYPFYDHTLKEITPCVLESIIQSYEMMKLGWYETPKGKEFLKKIGGML